MIVLFLLIFKGVFFFCPVIVYLKIITKDSDGPHDIGDKAKSKVSLKSAL